MRRRFGWSQRQLRGIVQDLAFLGRELVEASGLDFPLPRLRRHGTEALDRVSYRLAAVRRQASELRVGGSKRLLLLRCQVLPGLHALQNSLLTFWRKAVEPLQSL